MSAIQITKVREEPGETSLKVEIPPDVVREAKERAAVALARKARLPGFRQGRIPPLVVRRKFERQIIETVVNDLIRDSWKEALEQESLKPISEPRIRDLKFSEGEPLTFELLVEVKPTVEVSRFSGFSLTRRVPEVTDTIVAEHIDELRRSKAPWEPVPEGRPVPGDLVQITLAVRESPDEEPEARQAQFIIGQSQAIPDIEERVMELERGGVYEGVVQFPDDFADATKRGQSRGVRIELQEHKRQNLPPRDDSFARELGDFDTLADLEKAVRADLASEAVRESDADLRRQLVEHLIAANNIVAPRPMVHRVIHAFAEMYEVGEERFEEFAREFAPVAERQVQRDLLLDRLVEQHQLAATEAELDDRVAEIARSRSMEPGQVYASLQKAGRLRELERGITEKKVFDFLLSHNSVVEDKINA